MDMQPPLTWQFSQVAKRFIYTTGFVFFSGSCIAMYNNCLLMSEEQVALLRGLLKWFLCNINFQLACCIIIAQPVAPYQVNMQSVEVPGVSDLPIWSVKTFESGSNPNRSEAGAGAVRKTRVPVRVAPPPPRKKKKKKSGEGEAAGGTSESVEYAVPLTNSHSWFSRKKKAAMSKYKELNVTQVQPPSTYAAPNTSS